MAEPRDRLARAEDVAAIFARHRSLIRENRIFVDERGRSGGLFESPARRRTSAFGGRRFRRGLYGSPSSVVRENVADGGSGRRMRGSSGVLPSWYPRTPLRDITHVVRAIEKRRSYLRDGECQKAERLPSAPSLDDPSASSSSAPLNQGSSLVTPMPQVATRPFATGKIPKILLNITNQNNEDSELVSPQKKLLDSIDRVEKVLTEELQRQKGTPSARKAERHKRVRSLMSMR